MRYIFALCLLVLVAIGFWGYSSTNYVQHFGDAFTEAPQVQVKSVLTKPEDYLGKRVTLAGEVADQCPSSGCFFYFYSGKEKLRIELGELGASLPQREGSTAKVEGELVAHGDSFQFIGSAVAFE